ncbi:MAG TPA: sugar phosphate isomerase/epimerase [Epulopiscium sp.]|nr:sugar phosphate isomerase/epimerase [Candidatus Epulonipiscium sp.]
MIESMHKYMKVGLIHFMAYPETMKGEGPILETVKKIALDDYFTAIELTNIVDDAVRKKVKKLIDTANLDIAFGGQPMLLTNGLNINNLDEAGRAQAVAKLKNGIDQAYELGAKGFAFLSGNYEEETKEESYQALVKSTKELCAYSQSKGDIPVILEVFDYDMDKRSLIGPVDLAKRYVEEVREEYESFGLMVDLSHIPMLRETVEEAILPIKDYIVHAHMGNCVIQDPSQPGYGDSHPRFGFPGGENDVDELVEYLKVLMDIGYLSEERRPILSFEVKPFEDEDPDAVIANAKRTLNLAWARV